MKECTAPGCHRPVNARGLCSAHYTAKYRKEYHKQYYAKKKAKEWMEVLMGAGASKEENAAIGLIIDIEQAKSKQGKGQAGRESSSGDTCRGWV